MHLQLIFIFDSLVSMYHCSCMENKYISLPERDFMQITSTMPVLHVWLEKSNTVFIIGLCVRQSGILEFYMLKTKNTVLSSFSTPFATQNFEIVTYYDAYKCRPRWNTWKAFFLTLQIYNRLTFWAEVYFKKMLRPFCPVIHIWSAIYATDSATYLFT